MGISVNKADLIAEAQLQQQQPPVTAELRGSLDAPAAVAQAPAGATLVQAPAAGPAGATLVQAPAREAAPTPEEQQAQQEQLIQQRHQELISAFGTAAPEDRLLMARELGQMAGAERSGGTAAVLNAGEGVFGLGSRVGATVDWVNQLFSGNNDGQEFSYNEFLEYRRGQAEGAREAHPVAGTAGYIAGLGVGVVGPGGLALTGARAVAPAAVTRAFTPVAGQTAANIGRYAAAGSVAGGAQAGGEGNLADVPGGLAAGAIAGPIGRGAVALGARVIERVARPTAAALRRVASTIKRPGETLGDAARRVQQTSADFTKVHGRPPAVNELVDAVDDPALRQTVQMTEAGSRKAGELVQRQLVEAPEQLAAGVAGEGRRVATPAATVARRQDAEFDRVMRAHGATDIPVSTNLADIIANPTFGRFVIARGDDVSSMALRDVAEGRVTQLSLRALEDARSRLSKVLDRMGPGDRNYLLLANMRNALRQAGTDTVPEYGTALTRFGVREDIQAGIKIGQDVAAQADPAVIAAAVTNANPATRLGIRLGARSAVRRIVGTDPGGAAASVRRIAEDLALQRRLTSMLGADEAKAMIDAARIANRAFRSRLATLPASGAARDNVASMMKAALEAGALPTGRGSAGFMINVIKNLTDRLALSRAARQRLVAMAYDPERFPQVLAYLERQGITPGRFDAAIRQAAVAGQIAGNEQDVVGMAAGGLGAGAVSVVGGAIGGLGKLVGIGR